MRSMRGTALLAPTNRGRRFPDWPDWCYFPRGMAAVALMPDRKDDVDHVKVAHELESEQAHKFAPITWPEYAGVALLGFCTLAVGLYPRILLDQIEPAVRTLLAGGAQ